MARKPMALAVVLAIAALAAAAPASATFPGRNGLIAHGADDGVHVMRPDGTHDRLVSRIGPASDPAWGPHGRRIAFSHAGSIWVVNLNDGSTQRITHGRHDISPSWSSHGDAIAYSRSGGPGPYGLWIARLADGRQRRIVRAWSLYGVDWAPDGRWIAYTADFNVYLVRPDGRQAHRIVDFYSDGQERHYADAVSWAPNARRLAIGVLLNACWGCNGVYTVKPDGSNLEPVKMGDAQPTPFWSPNGRAIAYCHVRVPQSYDPTYRLHAISGTGDRDLGPTCGESWQARP